MLVLIALINKCFELLIELHLVKLLKSNLIYLVHFL